ncbi:MAG: thioesterase family protein [Bacteroidales bacterium]|nr:thioesterase family protein [Bacteroidales bacterium]MDD4672983.1 thioesterase family protein [Bacteroidales bacterium]MDY0348504.1 thioesterase family protein [Tenuifilaceae bacterium]
MENNLSVGLSHTLSLVVKLEHTAISHKSGTLPVLATPAMVAFVENAAMCAVMDGLPDGEATVGTRIDIRHLKATPVGMKIECKATLVQIEGRKLTFEVFAADEMGQIGVGTHVRYMVNKKDFMEKAIR